MNNEKIMNSRIQHKYDTAENWSKAVNFIPKAGEIIVYSNGIDGVGVPAIKIGDGVTKINDLPFAGNYYKDLTEEFNAQMEEGSVASKTEFLLTISNIGKYVIYDSTYYTYYCEINEQHGIFYHTITSYTDDGFKIEEEYINGEQVVLVENTADGTLFYTKLSVANRPESNQEVANKEYVDESINSASAVYSVENNCLFIRYNK